LGRSFTSLINSSNSCPTFHTFRYDFKPASIDLDKAGKVITGDREDDVSVNLPHVAESNFISTLFGGNQRLVDKECVLIVDKQSGEMILELVSTTVNLKRIRDEPRPGVQIKPPTQTTPTPASGGAANNDTTEKSG
jgi:ELL-associated factor